MTCRAALSALLSALTAALGPKVRAVDIDNLQTEITGVNTDTRTIEAGQLFVALEGERFNGHDFAEKAVAGGAIATLTRHGVITADLPRIEVPDTLAAYQALGRWWRRQLSLPVIAITGSVGKTTTKELIAAALSHHGQVHKTRANFNNEIGVPKTLLEVTPSHDYAVVEMGMRGPGEIALLTQIAEPNIAVITNVGTAHIGRLGSEQAIADAKCELLAELPQNGIAVLNYDNARLIKTAAGVWQGPQITYGLTGGDVHGEMVDSETMTVDGVRIPLPLTGEHNALNLLSAIATLQALNLDWRFLQNGLQVHMPAGRAQRHALPNDVIILDETYNAGAESMVAALKLLATQPGQRRVAVLGTMKELGQQSIELHQRVGQTVADLNLDQLFILADPAEADALSTGAGTIPSQQFTAPNELVSELKNYLQPGDRVLFKASRSVALDKVVDQLVSAALE